MTERTIIKAERKAKLIDELGGVCADCGTDENLSFDHVDHDREDRLHIITVMIEADWDRLMAEIRKCQLLCLSCHAKKTAREQGKGPSEHGTIARYINHKCRCDKCRSANAQYSRIIRARRKLI